MTWAVPNLENRIMAQVQSSIASLSETPIMVGVHGYAATLTGQVENSDKKQALLAAAGSAPGVRTVIDRLSISEPNESNSSPSGQATIQIAANDQVTTDLSPEDSIGPVSPGSSDDGSVSNGDPVNQPASGIDSEIKATGLPEAQQRIPVRVPEPTEKSASPAGSSDETDGTPAAGGVSTDRSSALPAEQVQPIKALQLPTITLNVAGNILTVEGTLSNMDDPTPLVRAAMRSFDLDYVSNSIEVNTDTPPARFLEPLERLIPLMKPLANPLIEVVEKQITLGGVARDGQSHDAVIGAALETLGEYSLVERISIDDTFGQSNTSSASGTVATIFAQTVDSDALNTATTDGELDRLVSIPESPATPNSGLVTDPRSSRNSGLKPEAAPSAGKQPAPVNQNSDTIRPGSSTGNNPS